MNDRTLAGMDRTEVDGSGNCGGARTGAPRWIVIFGTYTREFICLPRLAVPPGFRVVAIYPEAAADRMSKVGAALESPGRSLKWGPEERTGKA